MDGVIYHGNNLLHGAAEFLDWLKRENKHYLFLTNASEKSPRELQQKLERMGLDVGEEHFYTSALATARFVSLQTPGATAYLIGDTGLANALYDAGITMNDIDPDYVIVGETKNYNYEMIKKAVHLVNSGARLIATNTDITGPDETGLVPACRSLVSPIEIATGNKAYFIGKPNPLIMRTALKKIDVHSGDAVMIGDNMTTDIRAGIESGLTTVLVLTGVTTYESIPSYPYIPKYVIDGIGDIVWRKE